MKSPDTYGHTVVFQRFKANGGGFPETEELTITRKGTEHTARRAAGLTPRFHRIISITPIPMAAAPAPRRRKGPAIPEPVTPAKALWQVATPPPSLPEEEVASLPPPPPMPRPVGPSVTVFKGMAADAMDDVRTLAHELAELTENERRLLERLEERLETIDRLAPDSGVAPLLDRCVRLNELRNMAELGSWPIQINRVMEAARDRLFADAPPQDPSEP